MRVFILFTITCLISLHLSAQESNSTELKIEKKSSASRFGIYNYPLRDVLGDFILGTEMTFFENWAVGPTASIHLRDGKNTSTGKGYGIGIQGTYFVDGSSDNSYFTSLAVRTSTLKFEDDLFWADYKKQILETEISIGNQWIWSGPFIRVGAHWIKQAIHRDRKYITFSNERIDDSGIDTENIIGLSFIAGYRF